MEIKKRCMRASLILGGCLMLGACSGHKTERSDTDTATPASADAPQEAPAFTDLDMFGLKGHVRKVVETPEYAPDSPTIYEFTEDGYLAGGFLGDDAKMTRDDRGRLVSAAYQTYMDDDEPYNVVMSIVRDDAGRIVSVDENMASEPTEKFTATTIHYDESGRISSVDYSNWADNWTDTFIYDESGRLTGIRNREIKRTFTYGSFDKEGNWTDRTSSDNGRATRTIQYYQ